MTAGLCRLNLFGSSARKCRGPLASLGAKRVNGSPDSPPSERSPKGQQQVRRQGGQGYMGAQNQLTGPAYRSFEAWDPTIEPRVVRDRHQAARREEQAERARREASIRQTIEDNRRLSATPLPTRQAGLRHSANSPAAPKDTGEHCSRCSGALWCDCAAGESAAAGWRRAMRAATPGLRPRAANPEDTVCATCGQKYFCPTCDAPAADRQTRCRRTTSARVGASR